MKSVTRALPAPVQDVHNRLLLQTYSVKAVLIAHSTHKRVDETNTRHLFIPFLCLTPDKIIPEPTGYFFL